MRDHKILFERVYGQPENVLSESRFTSPSPNSFTIEDLKVWIDFFDMYQEETFPHLLCFETWNHALDILSSVNLQEISTAMTNHNEDEYFRITQLWADIFFEDCFKQ
mmetsp:Transcript_8404/g.31361  ORF Transcript_8404/g.31361 Transcript_8404/m.31361 type:complete len:107 (+) Transcript_8404:358-678(+)